MQDKRHGEKVIVGLGLTGLSCARYLASKQENFMVVDSRKNPPGLAGLLMELPATKLELGEFSEETLNQASELIVSPGVDLRTPALHQAVEKGIPITGDIDIFSKAIQARIIAITGSNAKSTVVTLLGEMAAESGVDVMVAGNIGTPVLDLLKEKKRELYVLELSSFQLETTTNLGAEVATVLNMCADHMDRYDSMEAYHQAKHKIFSGCKKAVVNRDDPLSRPVLPGNIPTSSFGLSLPEPGHFGVKKQEGIDCLAYGTTVLMPATELKIIGMHNVSNALAALALGHAAGLDMDSMLAVLRKFPGLPHRCQWVAERNAIAYYNDSKGTNVGATIAAIRGLGQKTGGKLVLIAGGVGKGAEFNELKKPIAEYCRLTILIGEDGPRIERALGAENRTVYASSMQEAVAMASALAISGDAVLLSPACASFDMFDNYQHRGEVFASAVNAL
ncbi:MAG: UDP-N-acetylmuramoyl-L-alanine--D-glutamate ligase [Pseudomonadales bacterium]|nr:UDP-N-acetylmuramoyl-L-alanine--D-glutamate ligase [Pseudomonadales bacterium]